MVGTSGSHMEHRSYDGTGELVEIAPRDHDQLPGVEQPHADIAWAGATPDHRDDAGSPLCRHDRPRGRPVVRNYRLPDAWPADHRRSLHRMSHSHATHAKTPIMTMASSSTRVRRR